MFTLLPNVVKGNPLSWEHYDLYSLSDQAVRHNVHDDGVKQLKDGDGTGPNTQAEGASYVTWGQHHRGNITV